MFDSYDLNIIRHLQDNARITWAELAQRLGLSAPAAAERVRKLEEQKAIKGYSAMIDPEALGFSLTAFIAVSLDSPKSRQSFLDFISGSAEVQECHHMAGDDDFLLKVRCTGTRHLEHLITERLKALPGIARTRTMIALSTLKETASLPVHPD